jgi:hypothetical protein
MRAPTRTSSTMTALAAAALAAAATQAGGTASATHPPVKVTDPGAARAGRAVAPLSAARAACIAERAYRYAYESYYQAALHLPPLPPPPRNGRCGQPTAAVRGQRTAR